MGVALAVHGAEGVIVQSVPTDLDARLDQARTVRVPAVHETVQIVVHPVIAVLYAGWTGLAVGILAVRLSVQVVV
jgi:hypothetical protein